MKTLLADVLLYDGLGNPPYSADLLLEDDRIRQIVRHGTVVFPGVKQENFSGCSVSPGWIDAHGHSDASLFAAPEAFGKISQGITTEIAGNCGLSAFPVTCGEVREHLRILYARYGLNPDWTDFRGYADALDLRRPAINLACLCGHNTLRAAVLGYDRKTPAPEELAAMCRLLKKCLEQGAAGFSTGLLYVPGCFSAEAELLALLETTAHSGRPYATHLRNEGDRLEEALEEAIRLSRMSGAALQLSHLKTALPRNWHKLDSVLERINRARAAGQCIHADRYPYTYSQTSLSIVLESPFDVMTDRAIRDALQEEDTFRKAQEMLSVSGRDWSRVILSCSNAPSAEGLCGHSVKEAAELRGCTPAELTVKILREDAPGTMAAFGGMSEENLKRILAQDWVCCGTDETARPQDVSLGTSHPRGFGSFPRFIAELRTQGLPMERIIPRLTALPAQIFRLRNRGAIVPGAMADLVVFDEEKLSSAADFQHPHTLASGIVRVFVAGHSAYDGMTGTVSSPGYGRVLRHPDFL